MRSIFGYLCTHGGCPGQRPIISVIDPPGGVLANRIVRDTPRIISCPTCATRFCKSSNHVRASAIYARPRYTAVHRLFLSQSHAITHDYVHLAKRELLAGPKGARDFREISRHGGTERAAREISVIGGREKPRKIDTAGLSDGRTGIFAFLLPPSSPLTINVGGGESVVEQTDEKRPMGARRERFIRRAHEKLGERKVGRRAPAEATPEVISCRLFTSQAVTILLCKCYYWPRRADPRENRCRRIENFDEGQKKTGEVSPRHDLARDSVHLPRAARSN